MTVEEQNSAILEFLRGKNSRIMKFLRDPACPKILYTVLSLLQLFFFSICERQLPFYSIIISSLTFLVSFFFLILIVAKKTHHLKKCIILRLLVGRRELSWNGIYYVYAVIFGTLNFLTHIHTIAVATRHGSMVQSVTITLIGFGLSLMYFMEAYKTYVDYAADKMGMGDEEFGLKVYTGFLKVIGRFPAFMKLVVVVLSVVWLILDPILQGTRPHTSSYTYYESGREQTSYYTYYEWQGFQAYVSLETGAGIITIVFAGIIVFLATSNILLTTVPCIRTKFFGDRWDKNFVASGLTFGTTISIATLAVFGLSFSLIFVGHYFIPTIFYGVLSIITLLMVISEAHIKPEEIGFKPIEIDPQEDDQKSMLLPKNLAKNIMNPVVTDELKSQLVPDEVIIGNPYSDRPLFQ